MSNDMGVIDALLTVEMKLTRAGHCDQHQSHEPDCSACAEAPRAEEDIVLPPQPITLEA